MNYYYDFGSYNSVFHDKIALFYATPIRLFLEGLQLYRTKPNIIFIVLKFTIMLVMFIWREFNVGVKLSLGTVSWRNSKITQNYSN